MITKSHAPDRACSVASPEGRLQGTKPNRLVGSSQAGSEQGYGGMTCTTPDVTRKAIP